MEVKCTLLYCWFIALVITLGVQGQDAASDLINRINQLRASLGLHGYTLNSALTAAAQNQANWMANTGQISHTQPDGSTPRSRAAAQGYPSSAVSENIYMGSSTTAATAWQWWLNSPIHYRGITNAIYTEVGIASATGSSGTAYVLVFGSPTGWQAPASNASSSGSNVSDERPSFVVGVDNTGNIMHEIQPGQTLGEIALIYGYTWDDLQFIRDLNEMTETEGRKLSIGAVILIPPWDGTYTPTPGAVQSTLERTAEQLTPAPAHTVLPTLTPTDSPELAASLDPVATLEDEAPPISTLEPTTPAWSVATMTPTAIIVAQIATPPNRAINTSENNNNTPPLLMAALVLQMLILGIAGYEFFMGRRH